MVSHFRCAPLVLAAISLAAATSDAGESPALADLLRRASLVAHGRIGGELPVGERRHGERLYLVEVIDAAQGCLPGQLIPLNALGTDETTEPFHAGEALILLATREVDGVYRPLDGQAGRWRIDRDGRLTSHFLQRQMPPTLDAGAPADAIAWLWNEARQYDFAVSLALHADDLRRYERGRPLRLEIAIDNLGGHPLKLNNHIEFVYQTRGLRKVQAQRRESLPLVKIYAQPLSDEHLLAEMARMVYALRPLTVAAGQRCAAEYDLSQEGLITLGMRYQVWAECGGRQSLPIVFELPGRAEAVELMAKLAELEDDGPLRIVERNRDARQPMPMVQPTDEAEAIDAAINAWLAASNTQSFERLPRRGDAAREIVLLSRAHLPAEFSSTSQNYHFVVAEPRMDRPEKTLVFPTQHGSAMFRGRWLCVAGATVGKQRASVELGEVERGRIGAAAIVQLERARGSWRPTGEIQLVHR